MASVEDPTNRDSNVWYDLCPVYSGAATISLEGVDEAVHGTATAEYKSDGSIDVSFTCSNEQSSRILGGAIWRNEPGVVPAIGLAKPTRLTIAADPGTYTAEHKLQIADFKGSIDGGIPELTVRPLGSTLRCDKQLPAGMFVMPLFNMLSSSFELYPTIQPDSIAYHPLRIYPTPPPNPQPTRSSEIDRNQHNRLITFKLDESVGFIEALPDYDASADALRSGRESCLITALLVCNAATRPCSSDDTKSWFPIDILNLLSVATGRRVGAPWIEYRSESGELLSRVHVTFGRPTFRSGHAVLLEEYQSNTGYLLTEGMKCADISSSPRRIILNHLINAGDYRRSLEDRFLSLSRSFELLARQHNLATQDMKSRLDLSTRADVSSYLSQFRSTLAALAKTANDPEQASLINRIADRVLAADQRDKNFGDAVADVANAIGFFDKEVLINGFTSSDGRSWTAFLSYVRGLVVHEGGFDFFNGTLSVGEIVSTCNHLHDLLIRIVLKSLGFDSKYSSPIPPGPILRELDWVEPNTLSSDLIR